MRQVSVLVVSRTIELLNRLISRLDDSYSGDNDSTEILISWNGKEEDLGRISQGRFQTSVAQQEPYHFASNINQLCRQAQGEVIVLANDDLIPDPGSIDAAVEKLREDPQVGIVGARLRSHQYQLAHAGIHFKADGSAFHRLENLVRWDDPELLQDRYVPAVTGAFLAIRRLDLLHIVLDEEFSVCGEDVALCLNIQNQLNKSILYCHQMSGCHNAETTRKGIEGQGANDADINRMRNLWESWLELANQETLKRVLRSQQEDSNFLHQLIPLREDQWQAIHDAELQAAASDYSCRLQLLEDNDKRLRSQIQQLLNQGTALTNRL